MSWRRVADQLGLDFNAVSPFMHGSPPFRSSITSRPDSPSRSGAGSPTKFSPIKSATAPSCWKPGAEDLVRQLQGLPWAVVTSGTRRLAEASMRKAGMQPPAVV